MTTLYRKEGRRYVPVAESDTWGSLPQGFHLLAVQPGIRSTRFNVDPCYADVLAALKACREDVMAAWNKASEARPEKTLLTPRERKALAAYKEIAGVDSLVLQRPSASDIVDALELALMKRMGG